MKTSLRRMLLPALLGCLGSFLGCRQPAAGSNSPATVAQKPGPQPSVCAAENVSRAGLLQAKPTPAASLR